MTSIMQEFNEIEKKVEELKDLIDEEVEVSCIDCDDTGEVRNEIFDYDSKEWIVDGVKKCHCQYETGEDEILQDR